MTSAYFDIGAAVLGSPMSPRAIVQHWPMFDAYARGEMAEAGETREGYLSAFAFGPDFQSHYEANGRSVAGFDGPCWSRFVTFDIDRGDLDAALADARKLVASLLRRYPSATVVTFFSGGKGFHVLLELAHRPPPAVNFHSTVRVLAGALAAEAGVPVDPTIYDKQRILRLPNTRHPKTGRFKRLLTAEELFGLTVEGIVALAQRPCCEFPTEAGPCPEQLPKDWADAEREAIENESVRKEKYSGEFVPDAKAPRYVEDFLRGDVVAGDEKQGRHVMTFRVAAWLTEQGAPPSLVHALCTNPALDLKLLPKDVRRQIECGIEFARKKRKGLPADLGDAWEHPADRAADPQSLTFDPAEFEKAPSPAAPLSASLGAFGELVREKLGAELIGEVEADWKPPTPDPTQERPNPPPGSEIIVAGPNGHTPPDRGEAPFMWTWPGAATWYYVRDWPIPEEGRP